MPKVFLTMQYEIKGGKREKYLQVIQELKTHYSANQFVEYCVTEQKGKKNHFEEMFIAHSEDAFKKFEESEDEKADSLAAQLTSLIEGKAKYSTLVEIV